MYFLLYLSNKHTLYNLTLTSRLMKYSSKLTGITNPNNVIIGLKRRRGDFEINDNARTVDSVNRIECVKFVLWRGQRATAQNCTIWFGDIKLSQQALWIIISSK